jgi:hypothetical protein
MSARPVQITNHWSPRGNLHVALRHMSPDRDVVLMNDDVECVTPGRRDER